AQTFPARQERARETLLVGFTDEPDEPPDPDTEGEDNWSLLADDNDNQSLLVDEEPPGEGDEAPAPAEPAQAPGSSPAPEASLEATNETASPGTFDWDTVDPAIVVRVAPMRETEADRRLRQVALWAGRALMVWLLFAGSFMLGQRLLRPSVRSPQN